MFSCNENENRSSTIKVLDDCFATIGALEPCYGKNGGNATPTYTRQGDILEDSRRLMTVLKHLTCHYSKDLVSLRKNYGEVLGITQNVPLPLSLDLVLVPLK